VLSANRKLSTDHAVKSWFVALPVIFLTSTRLFFVLEAAKKVAVVNFK
jgi:hypothetical protein